ncbi:MAG: Na/Pi symporter [Clostridia bacterium]|nr:Na/Pi symporter [Clostridia bacterium]
MLEILYQIMIIFASLGAIIYGIRVMNSSIEMVVGYKFKKALAKGEKRPLISYMLGTGVSFATQTSTLTNVMATGFINIGIIGLSQGVVISLGACFGASLAMILLMFESVSVLKILSVLAFVGAISLIISKSKRGQTISKLFLGLGLLCFGITILGTSVNTIIETVDLTGFFVSISNPMLLLLIGIAISTIMQSAYPIVAIIITLLSTGLIDFNSACYLALGANVGAGFSISLLISGFSEGNNGRRMVLFNVLQRVFVTILFYLLMLIPNWNLWIHNSLCGGIASVSVVLMMIIYSFVPIVFVPLSNKIATLLRVIIKDKKDKRNDEYSCFEIDEKVLNSSLVSYNLVKNNVQKIFKLELDLNNELTEELLLNGKENKYRGKLKAIEKAIKLTSNNLIRISGKVAEKEIEKVNVLINILNDCSRILKINTEFEGFLQDKNKISQKLSEEQFKFIIVLNETIKDIGERIYKVFDENIAKKVKKDELNIIFKVNNMVVAKTNESKHKLLKKNNINKDNSLYFKLLNELSELQNEYVDVTIKMSLLEE